MPKYILFMMLLVMTTLVLIVAGCGSGDNVGVPERMNPAAEIQSGVTGTNTGGGTGGTSGGTGACVVSSGCWQGIDQSICQNYYSGTFYLGQTCGQRGYTTYCTPPSNGVSYCY